MLIIEHFKSIETNQEQQSLDLPFWSETIFSINKINKDKFSFIAAGAHSGCSQRSKVRLLAEIVNRFQPLPIFVKSPILNAGNGCE